MVNLTLSGRCKDVFAAIKDITESLPEEVELVDFIEDLLNWPCLYGMLEELYNIKVKVSMD